MFCDSAVLLDGTPEWNIPSRPTELLEGAALTSTPFLSAPHVVEAFFALALFAVNGIRVAINNKTSTKYQNRFIFDTPF